MTHGLYPLKVQTRQSFAASSQSGSEYAEE